MGKSQNKVGLAEEIGYKNDIVLSKIGHGNELGWVQKPVMLGKKFKSRKNSSPGRVDESKSCFKNCLQQLTNDCKCIWAKIFFFKFLTKWTHFSVEQLPTFFM